MSVSRWKVQDKADAARAAFEAPVRSSTRVAATPGAPGGSAGRRG